MVVTTGDSCLAPPPTNNKSKNMTMKKYTLAVGASVLAAFAPLFAFADTLSTSTAQTIAEGAVNDLGSVLAGLIPEILVVVVSLLAIGMGIRYVKKHISGKKF